MDPDLFLVIGIVIGVLAIPSLLNAYSSGQAPRAGAIAVLVSGILILLAVTQKPGGYQVAELPDVFYRVVGRVLN